MLFFSKNSFDTIYVFIKNMNAFKSFLIFVKISKLYSSLNGKGYIFTTRTTLNYLGLTCTTMFIHISKNFIFSAYYILKDITYVF